MLVVIRILVVFGVVIGTAAPIAAAYIAYVTNELWLSETKAVAVKRLMRAGTLVTIGFTMAMLLAVVAPEPLAYCSILPFISVAICATVAGFQFSYALRKLGRSDLQATVPNDLAGLGK